MAVLVKTLLNSQKRLNIITLDLVLLVLFSTSSTLFIDKITDISNLLTNQSLYSYIFGWTITYISLYFLLLQFYEFESDRIATLICDLFLISNFLFNVIFLNF